MPGEDSDADIVIRKRSVEKDVSINETTVRMTDDDLGVDLNSFEDELDAAMDEAVSRAEQAADEAKGAAETAASKAEEAAENADQAAAEQASEPTGVEVTEPEPESDAGESETPDIELDMADSPEALIDEAADVRRDLDAVIEEAEDTTGVHDSSIDDAREDLKRLMSAIDDATTGDGPTRAPQKLSNLDQTVAQAAAAHSDLLTSIEEAKEEKGEQAEPEDEPEPDISAEEAAEMWDTTSRNDFNSDCLSKEPAPQLGMGECSKLWNEIVEKGLDEREEPPEGSEDADEPDSTGGGGASLEDMGLDVDDANVEQAYLVVTGGEDASEAAKEQFERFIDSGALLIAEKYNSPAMPEIRSDIESGIDTPELIIETDDGFRKV